MKNRIALVLVLLPLLMSMFVCGSTADYDTCLLLCEVQSGVEWANCVSACCDTWPVQCEEAAQQ